VRSFSGRSTGSVERKSLTCIGWVNEIGEDSLSVFREDLDGIAVDKDLYGEGFRFGML
jgi:hypothetical protein